MLTLETMEKVWKQRIEDFMKRPRGTFFLEKCPQSFQKYMCDVMSSVFLLSDFFIYLN